jgi:membrane protease YdiL (CAAX protease family)
LIRIRSTAIGYDEGKRMSAAKHRKRTGVFFGLVFAISWTFWGLSAALPTFSGFLKIAGTFGPSLAALILVWQHPKTRRDLLARLVQWRFPAGVWLFSLALPVVGILLALVLTATHAPAPIWPDLIPLWMPLAIFAYILVFSVAGEELGWRGYALPLLIEAHGPQRASLFLGAVWAIWHAPLFFLPGDFHEAIPPGLFALQIVASSFIYTQLHLASCGSLIPAHLFHASFNASVGIFPVLPQARGGDPSALVAAVSVLCVVAALAAYAMRQKR